MALLSKDVRDAVRSLLRSRGYTIVVVLTLGLGIGLNTAIFTVVDALLLKPLPYPDAASLVRVAEWPKNGGNYTVAPAAFLRWRGEVRSFTYFEARIAGVFVLLQGGTAEALRGARVTANYFNLLGIQPAQGRTFTLEDERAGAPCVAIVSHRLWSTKLSADSSVLGKPLRFSGQTCAVVGVLPADSVFDRTAVDLYAPLAFSPADSQNNGRVLTVWARLAHGVALEGGRAEMASLAAALNADRGDAGRGWTTALTPIRDVVIGADSRRLAAALFGAVVVVLVVACLNVAGLALARTVTRRREIAIRTALGANRWRTFRFLMVESVLLAALGGVAGILLGGWGLRALTSLAPPGLLPAEAAAALDGRALLFTAALSIVTGLFFGTYPAWRGTSAQPIEALIAGGRTAGPSRFMSRIHSGLLVVEIALAMVLVVAASALVVSFVRLFRVDPGFSAPEVLTTRIVLPSERYASPEAIALAFDQMLQAFRRIPDVERAGAATSLPLGGWLFGTTFTLVGEPASVDAPKSVHIQHATDGYLEALGIPLVAGRYFTAQDTERAPRVAIVNETFVRRYGGGAPLVGRELRLGIAAALWEIVGVIRDVKTGGLADADLATPEIYVPHRQSPMPAMFVALRAASGRATRLTPALRAALRSVDPELPLGAVLTMDERLGGSVRRERFRTVMISTSAGLALLLACLGVYAIRSQAVSSRFREMGLRVALGATPRQILTMVLRQGLGQVLIGLVIGAGAAVGFTRLVEPWLFATRMSDPRIMAGAGVIFGIAALAASWMPAHRASSVDPLVLLKLD